jgi:hypothetical protein
MDLDTGIAADSASREVVQALKRLSPAELSDFTLALAAAIGRGETLESARVPLGDVGAASLLAASIVDAARNDASLGSLRSWWESAGLDAERAGAVASAASSVVPLLAARIRAEGAVGFNSALCIPTMQSLFVVQHPLPAHKSPRRSPTPSARRSKVVS